MSRCLPSPIASLAGLVLAACSGGGEVVPTGALPLPLVAHGNEPFWWLRLDVGAAAFGTLGDEAMFAAEAVTGPQRAADGSFVLRAETARRRLAVTLVPGVVTDSMTGMPFPYAVDVSIDGREWRGVGGDPGDLLRGFPWVVTQVGDRQLPAVLRPTLEFRRDDVLVFAVADGVTLGRWSVGGESLQLSGFDSLPSPMREALRDGRTFSISAGGELVLEGGDGVALRATRQRP